MTHPKRCNHFNIFISELFFLHDGEYKQLAIINYISAMQGKCIKYLEGTLIRSAEVVSAKIS